MKVAYFPLALEPAQLLWLDSLPENIIDSWPTLRRLFIDNFQGVMTRAGTRHDLSQCKQNKNESLQEYTKCFFKKRTTIANISDDNIIDCFCQGLFYRFTFRDFECQRPWSIMELRDMMTKWAENEEQEMIAFQNALTTTMATRNPTTIEARSQETSQIKVENEGQTTTSQHSIALSVERNYPCKSN